MIDRLISADLMNIQGERVGKEPADEREHFYPCEVCGQSVDMRNLGEILYHAEAGHKPLPRQ